MKNIFRCLTVLAIVLVWSCSKERVDFDKTQLQEINQNDEVIIDSIHSEDTLTDSLTTDSSLVDSALTDSVVTDTATTVVEDTTAEEEEEEIVLVDPTAFIENLKAEKQTLTGGDWDYFSVTTSKGMYVKGYVSSFEDLSGNDVEPPIDIRIKEILTPKDMILNNVPSTAGGELLVSGGEFYIEAYKDGQELKLKDWYTYEVYVPTDVIDQNMEVFVGTSSGEEFEDWESAMNSTTNDLNRVNTWNDTVQSPSGGPTYSMTLGTLGWINCDYFYKFTGSKTAITFTSDTLELDYVRTYIYVPEANSVVRVYGESSGQIPVGEEVKIVCYAVDSNNDPYYQIETITVEDGHSFNISLTKGTESSFTSALDGL